MKHASTGIPDVQIMAFNVERPLEIDQADGYVGEVHSGHATVIAVVGEGADPTIGLFRDGRDNYIRQKELMGNARTPAQEWMRDTLLASANVSQCKTAYGVKVPLRVDERSVVNTAHYPENMLMLAQYERENGMVTGKVTVWKIAFISQNGQFFVTAENTYEVQAYRGGEDIVFPRFAAHEGLGDILAGMLPGDIDLEPESAFVRVDDRPTIGNCRANEGVVERWYGPRGMGSIITRRGMARVHWSDVPMRPRRRFLVPGEIVRFASLGPPPDNPATDLRKMRRPRFRLQAYGISVHAEVPNTELPHEVTHPEKAESSALASSVV